MEVVARIVSLPSRKVETDAAVKGDLSLLSSMLVLTPRVIPRVKIEPFGRVKGQQRAGVVKRNSKIKNVGVRIEEVGARIDRFHSFQGDEFAELQVEAALGDEWESEG